ncbi:MAG: type II toxin-antitoxin system PemK/MazF family toxin [Deltaproteobacteria bacterium]|nr:type II toxin-antitoxin system PemK/MazF family toxin [Deltaproteobacteria bacterium]
MLRRGHLYWAHVPDDKRRPVLVVSPEERNTRALDAIVVPLTTVVREGPWHVRLRRGEGGAPQASVLKCERVTTLRTARIDDRPLGPALGPTRMAEVERGILRAIGVPV